MELTSRRQLSALERRELAERLVARPGLLPEDLPVDRGEYRVFPLTKAQQHLFAHQQRDETSSAYNISAGLTIDGQLEPQLLQQIVQQLVDRHEALRTRFGFRQGTLWQLIAEQEQADFDLTDLSGLPADEAVSAARTAIDREALRPFELLSDRILRCRVYRLSERRHYLLLCVHHIVADFMSMELLAAELSLLYHAALNGEVQVLPPLRLQFPDFALWERAFLASPKAQSQLAYWQDALAAMPALHFPDQVQGEDPISTEGGWIGFAHHAELMKLRQRAAGTETTMFMLGLAAIHQLISAYCQTDDLAVGTPIGTRRVADLEQSIGLLLNTLVIRVDGQHCDSGDELLKTVRQRCAEAFEHKDYPYEGLQEAARRRDKLQPDYRVRYVYRRINEERTPASDLQIGELELKRRDAKFDLLISINESDDQLFGEIEYRKAVIRDDSAALMAEQLGRILGWIADPQQCTPTQLRQDLADQHTQLRSARKRQRRARLEDQLLQRMQRS